MTSVFWGKFGISVATATIMKETTAAVRAVKKTTKSQECRSCLRVFRSKTDLKLHCEEGCFALCHSSRKERTDRDAVLEEKEYTNVQLTRLVNHLMNEVSSLQENLRRLQSAGARSTKTQMDVLFQNQGISPTCSYEEWKESLSCMVTRGQDMYLQIVRELSLGDTLLRILNDSVSNMETKLILPVQMRAQKCYVFRGGKWQSSSVEEFHELFMPFLLRQMERLLFAWSQQHAAQIRQPGNTMYADQHTNLTRKIMHEGARAQVSPVIRRWIMDQTKQTLLSL